MCLFIAFLFKSKISPHCINSPRVFHRPFLLPLTRLMYPFSCNSIVLFYCSLGFSYFNSQLFCVIAGSCFIIFKSINSSKVQFKMPFCTLNCFFSCIRMIVQMKISISSVKTEMFFRQEVLQFLMKQYLLLSYHLLSQPVFPLLIIPLNFLLCRINVNLTFNM